VADEMMTEDEARQAGFVPPDEATPQAAPQQASVMSEQEARAAGYVPPHEADPNVMSPEEARAAGYEPGPELKAQSPLETTVRRAIHEAPAALGSIPAMVAGGGQGAIYGAEAGLAIAGPPGAAVGAAVGGIGGALIAGAAAGTILQKASSLVEHALGLDEEEQLAVNKAANPKADIAGELLPWAATFRPSARLALKARATMGAGMAGFSAAQQKVTTGEIDPMEVAAQGGFAALADKPYGVGKKLVKTGELFAGPSPRMGHNDAPPPPPKTDVSENPNPAVRDNANDGHDAKDTRPAEGSDAVVQRGDVQEDISAALKGQAPAGDKVAQFQKSLEATDFQPPSDEVKAAAPAKKPTLKVPAEMAEPLKGETDFSEGAIPKDAEPPVGEDEPISARLPSLEAQHAQDIAPITNAQGQAEALQRVRDKVTAPQTAEPLTAAQEAVPERAARPAAAEAAIAGERPPTKAALAVQAKQEAAARAADAAFPKARVIQPDEVKSKTIRGLAAAQRVLEERPELFTPEETARSRAILEGGTDAQIAKEAQKIRNKANRKMVEGTNVQVNDAADAARKNTAAAATRSAIEAFPPKEGESVAEVKTRLQGMLDHATKENGGITPLEGYAPKEKPAAFELLREARDLLKGDMAPEKIADFENNEYLARKELEQDPKATNVLGTKRIEADTALRDELPNEETNLGGRTLDEARNEAEDEATKNLTKNVLDDTNPYDLTTKAGIAKVRADTAKVIPNLIKTLDDKALKSSQPQWWRDTEENAAKTAKLKRAREAAANVEHGYREPPVPDKEHFEKSKGKVYQGEEGDIAQKALDDYKAKQKKTLPEPAGYAADLAAREARAAENTAGGNKPISEAARRLIEQREETHPEITPTVENLAPRFLNDTSGSVKIPTVNIPAVNAAIKAQGEVFKKGLRKYLGAVFSDSERVTKSILTQMTTHAIGLRSDFRNFFDADWHVMNKAMTEGELYSYLDQIEKTSMHIEAQSGVGPREINRAEFVKNLRDAGFDAKKADMLADRAPIIRDQLDQMWHDDKKYGSTADYVANYAPHIFSKKVINGMTAEEWINARNEGQPKSIGSTTHQQERVFDTIKAARAAGYELRYNNVYDLLSARYAASVEFHMLIGGLRRMQEYGLAVPASEATGAQKAWKEKGGVEYNAPDHNRWIVHPDAVPLWQNAQDARGLRNSDSPLGSFYRTWMKLKNVWVPIELSLTAFHAVHVVGINFAENLTGATHELMKTGDISVFKDALKNSATQPLLMLPLEHMPFGLGEKYAKSALGKAQLAARENQMVQWWNKPANERTAVEKMWQRIYDKGGMLARQPAEERIIGEHDLARSIANNDYLNMSHQGLRLAVQKASGGMFTQWIPDLKNAAYQNAITRALKLDPTLMHDQVKFAEVARSIGNDIHSRYGEMNYKTLFWKPWLRDVGVGSFLSLSWQLGQLNQLAKAAHGLVSRAGGTTMERMGNLLGDEALTQAGKARQGTRLQSKVYEHSTAGTYVMTYVGTSMMFAGAMSYMLSGKFPTGMDYFYPRNGNTNPDGTEGRYTSPFNTREGPMLKGHIDATDSVYEGVKELLYNKMVIQPLMEIANNRDHFGNEMYSIHSPAYKQALELMDSELGRRLNPISITGAARAKQLGGGLKDQIAAFAGFGPAPAYTSKSPLDAQIGELYKKHSAPESRPYETSGTGLVKNIVQGPNQAQQRSDAKAAKYAARAKGDTEGEDIANRKLIATGISPVTLKKLQPGEDSQYFFSRLPEPDKLALINEKMTADQFTHYVLQNHAITGKMDRSKLVKAWATRNVNQ
jgi:hypothetical protein